MLRTVIVALVKRTGTELNLPQLWPLKQPEPGVSTCDQRIESFLGVYSHTCIFTLFRAKC